MDLVTPDVRLVLRLADHAERGTFPAAGGVLDQANQFIEAMEFVRHEDHKLLAAARRE